MYSQSGRALRIRRQAPLRSTRSNLVLDAFPYSPPSGVVWVWEKRPEISLTSESDSLKARAHFAVAANPAWAAKGVHAGFAKDARSKQQRALQP
ncbi:unnamed protein product [Heligmosomoides polygyrus]|uniref:Transposase n=1 Tax=Heligmosomoides polygyrus TaxID=6339 RepID=A0A183FEN9_HELPZ|nr:unnamed protein product [Heligmosomoides polygyrus]